MLLDPYHSKVKAKIELYSSGIIFVNFFMLLVQLIASTSPKMTVLVFFLSFFFPVILDYMKTHKMRRLRCYFLRGVLKSDIDIELALGFYSQKMLAFNSSEA